MVIRAIDFFFASVHLWPNPKVHHRPPPSPLTTIILPTMSSSISNLSIDEQQATDVNAKIKEDDATAAAQATVATAHWEQEALVAIVVVACKTLVEVGAHKRAAALAWGKKTIARHLEQQLFTAQGIVIPQDNNDDCSVDADSNPDATLTVHLHVQAASL
jgi:hypothetical protein